MQWVRAAAHLVPSLLDVLIVTDGTLTGRRRRRRRARRWATRRAAAAAAGGTTDGGPEADHVLLLYVDGTPPVVAGDPANLPRDA